MYVIISKNDVKQVHVYVLCFHGLVDKGKIAVNQVFVGEGVVSKSCLLNLLKSFQETHDIKVFTFNGWIYILDKSCSDLGKVHLFV